MAPRISKPVTEAVDDINAQIAKLQEKKRAIIKKQAERVAKIVQDSGLAELDITDDDLLRALSDVASRFQNNATPSAGASAAKIERTHPSA